VTGLRDGRIDALVVSDPGELGARAMQAMRAALAGSNDGASTAQLPVHIVDRDSMERDPIVQILIKGPS
jgi:ABC-type sugar transport system substrate-binding protein